MTKSETWGARFGLALLGAGMLLAEAPALAQTPSGAWPLESSADALSRNLRTLAANPRSLEALMGAGRSALDLGDAQAALTFFARAEEVAPRDGRIKRWMASALVQLEQPQAALKFFKDATDLGVTDAEVAGDRGLAYDISGDPRRAQRDYRLALQHGADPEITRRLALSLAITGDRQAALQALEMQLRMRDKAAERTRALVLALTGDSAGAGRAVEASMPGPAAAAMLPFLARLPSLSYADRALAVHLGHFPSTGRSTSPQPVYASNPPARSHPQPSTPPWTVVGYSQSARSVTDAGKPDPAQALLERRVASSEARKPATPAPAAARPSGTAPPVTGASRPAEKPPVRTAQNGLSVPDWALRSNDFQLRPRARPAQTPAPAVRRDETLAPPVERPAVQAPAAVSVPPDGTAVAPETSATAGQQPTVAAQAEAPPPPAEAAAPQPSAVKPTEIPAFTPVPAPAEERSSSRLADLAAVVATIPDPPAHRAARRTEPAPAAKPQRKAADTPAPAAKPSGKGTELASVDSGKKGAPAKPAPGKKPAAPREPSRIWVQVAGGADKTALPREFARLKTKAPKIFGSRGAWTAPLNATNRLLVGPFEDAESAQDFVNQLRKLELHAFAWTSEAGEKVEKLSAK